MTSITNVPTGRTADDVVADIFLTREFRGDRRWALLDELRSVAPVHYSNALNRWVITSYAGCRDLLYASDTAEVQFEHQMDIYTPDWRDHASVYNHKGFLAFLDGQDHQRVRTLIFRDYTTRRVEQLRPRVRQIAQDLVAAFRKKGGGDFLDDVAFPLPIAVVGELFGVSEGLRSELRPLVRDMTQRLEPDCSAEEFRLADLAAQEIRAYFTQLVDERRRQPGDDLISAMLASKDGSGLTVEEVVLQTEHIFNAGFETTVNTIGNALYAFLHNPDEMAKLREPDSEAFAYLSDEVLRYAGTLQGVRRFTTGDVSADGVVIPAGMVVYAMVGAANRDPSKFEEPHRFQLIPRETPALGFGWGIHLCLGRNLARMEIDEVFRALFGQCSTIAFDGPAPEFRSRLHFRSLDQLKVKVA